jgi:hypothetical protein
MAGILLATLNAQFGQPEVNIGTITGRVAGNKGEGVVMSEAITLRVTVEIAGKSQITVQAAGTEGGR